MITAVVAMAKNGVIGRSGDLPWYLPADLRHFKTITLGHPVIMGRKTWESIYARLGKALPERTNIVLTRDRSFTAAGAVVVGSLDEALAAADEASDREVMVIGGAQVYEAVLPRLDRIYLTRVDADIEGDTFFPEPGKEWVEVAREKHAPDDKNPYPYTFITLDRRT
jgi:dihydrofolate reductase